MKLFLTVVTLFVLATTSFAQDHTSRACATVYQGDNLSRDFLDVKHGARIKDLGHVKRRGGGDWDNRISSIIVEAGCRLTGFQYLDFGKDRRTGQPIGWKRSFSNTTGTYRIVSQLLSTVDNKISSLKCFCKKQ